MGWVKMSLIAANTNEVANQTASSDSFAVIISIVAILFVVILTAATLRYGVSAFKEIPIEKKSKLDFSPR